MEDLKRPKTLRHCFNIDTQNDLSYSGKTSCNPFTRSDAICTASNVREQFNAITAFIDGSNVYGSDEETADKLRTKTDGKMQVHELGPTLPTRQQTQFESVHGQHPHDLVAGDVRAIEQPGLASIHSLFILEHNRISDMIKNENSELRDEEIYQTA